MLFCFGGMEYCVVLSKNCSGDSNSRMDNFDDYDSFNVRSNDVDARNSWRVHLEMSRCIKKETTIYCGKGKVF
jgi:hypothetical protein